MRVVIFGTGKIYTMYREKLLEMNIEAFLDNDKNKQGTFLDGKIIDLPENIGKYHYDYILITSNYYKEMRKQLEELGVDERLIIDAEHKGYLELVRKVEKYDIRENYVADKRVILITHDFSLTGAPLMLYYGSLLLKEFGYNVTIFSEADGPLKYDYLNHGISISMFSDFDFSDDEIKRYFLGCHMILVNTVVLFKLVRKLEKVNIPVMWWLHEEDNYYDIYNIKELPQYERLYVYGVGNRAINSYIKHSGSSNICELIYGIPFEVYNKIELQQKIDKKTVFAVIGYISERKGQDIFIAAINKNWEKWKDKAEFWIVGSITEQQKNQMEAIQKVKIFGDMDHSDLLRLYSEIDVVVCPSRNDPMPVVLAEAMMNKKVCIASDMTGTAEKITPYEDGLICRAGDVDSLSKQIDWVLAHQERLSDIGEKAYDIYEREFSEEQFRNKLLHIVSNIIHTEVSE